MTHTRTGLSIAASIAAVVASTASHAVEITAGDWTFTATGNVNAHYIVSKCEDSPGSVAGGLACIAAPGAEDTSSSVSNGLLPAALGLSASTTQAGYDLSVTFGLYPGISTNDGGSPNLQNNPIDPATGNPVLSPNTALGTTGLDVRQVFLTFGNERMGTVLAGRNIGLFGQDAILGDMTLLGVGAGGGDHAAPANTSLGSIGLGYIYTDWLAQINYTTPDFNGLKLTIGVFDPLEPLGSDSTPKAAPGFHGKVAWTANEKLYLSATFLHQKQEGVTDAGDFDSTAFDIGGKFKTGPVEFLAYYYNGSGVGTTGLFVLASDGLGQERDSDGFLAQVTFEAGRTKFGLNYGESNLDLASGEVNPTLVEKNSKYTLGVYHKTTENLTLLAEFTDIKSEAHNGVENKAQTFNVGAFLSF
jgi:predicted porin